MQLVATREIRGEKEKAMRLVGLGLDLVEVERVRRLLQRWGDRILEKVFLPEEIGYCRSRPDPPLHYAGRLAAKEAVFKALGEGWTERLGWRDVRVERSLRGAVSVALLGKGAVLARELGVSRIMLTLTHAEGYAAAAAAALAEEEKT